MTIVFQYGSNMNIERINKEDRLNGCAVKISNACTVNSYNFGFTVWSESNSCAAADLVPDKNGRQIFGVLYEIPDNLIERDSAKLSKSKSLDAIEGEGSNYNRINIDVIDEMGSRLVAKTYVALNRKTDIQTSQGYIEHILVGAQRNRLPEEYINYLKGCILSNNNILNVDLPT